MRIKRIRQHCCPVSNRPGRVSVPCANCSFCTRTDKYYSPYFIPLTPAWTGLAFSFICKKEYQLCLKSQPPVRKWSTGTLSAPPQSATFWLYKRVHSCKSTHLSGIKWAISVNRYRWRRCFYPDWFYRDGASTTWCNEACRGRWRVTELGISIRSWLSWFDAENQWFFVLVSVLV